MSNRGRRLILDAEIIETTEKLLKEGHYIRTVCNYFGISEQTWFNWYNKGNEYKELTEEELITKPNAILYIEFFEAVKRGSARAEMDALDTIHKHSKKKWQAAAWFLERRFRDRWGRMYQDDNTETGQSKLETFLKGLDEIANEEDDNDEYEDDGNE